MVARNGHRPRRREESQHQRYEVAVELFVQNQQHNLQAQAWNAREIAQGLQNLVPRRLQMELRRGRVQTLALPRERMCQVQEQSFLNRPRGGVLAKRRRRCHGPQQKHYGSRRALRSRLRYLCICQGLEPRCHASEQNAGHAVRTQPAPCCPCTTRFQILQGCWLKLVHSRRVSIPVGAS